MDAWLATLASVAVVSLAALAGLATLALEPARLRRVAAALMSLAVGTLLGDACLHLIPEAFADATGTAAPSAGILGGFLIFFAVEKLVRHRHGPLHAHAHPGSGIPPLASMNLLGDALHNGIDGALIAASWLAGPTLGLSTTIAVLLHEVPQELGDFGVLVRAGLPVRRAVAWNLATAATALGGAVATLALGGLAGAAAVDALLPVTAGGFVYIAAADLVPELHHDRGPAALAVQAVGIGAGLAIMAALRALG